MTRAPRGAVAALLLGGAGLLAGCGAKTGLCGPVPLTVRAPGVQVVFVIDQSTSMADGFDVEDPVSWEESRWFALRDALAVALEGRGGRIEVGAKLFPTYEWDPDEPSPFPLCDVAPGLDVEPSVDGAEALLALLDAGLPVGGTPTAAALGQVRGWLADHPDPSTARLVVLATDGGPNCLPAPPPTCLCTGPADSCEPVREAYFNCLDAERTLDAIDEVVALGSPVIVVGMDVAVRPDLSDFLDQMAVAGGRPRPDPSPRRFFDVTRPEQVEEVLQTVLSSVDLCVYTVSTSTAPRRHPEVELRADGELLPRDPSHRDGWDWTDAEAREITLFGPACELVGAGGARLEASAPCDDEGFYGG